MKSNTQRSPWLILELNKSLARGQKQVVKTKATDGPLYADVFSLAQIKWAAIASFVAEINGESKVKRENKLQMLKV